MNKIKSWFTPQKRVALQALVAVIIPLLVQLHIFDDRTGTQVLLLVGGLFQALAGALSLINLSPLAALGVISSNSRRILYWASTTIGPVFAALGFVTDAQLAWILAIVAQSFGILAAIVAVLGIVPFPIDPAASGEITARDVRGLIDNDQA
jgi:hypothetical protein